MTLASLSLRQFARFFILCAGLIYLLLGLGQVMQVTRIVGGFDRVNAWSVLLLHALVVLSEVVLPLAALFASIVVFGRWRSDGAALGFSVSGVRPLSLLIPVTLVASVVSGVTMGLAHYAIPHSIERIGEVVAQASGESLFRDTLSAGDLELVRSRGADGSEVIWDTVDGEGRPATLIRTESLTIEQTRPTALSGGPLQIWGPGYSISVRQAQLDLDTDDIARRLRMFGPPNALPSSSLNLALAHHEFTLHRRFSVPLLMVPWTILGAVLGLMSGGVFATVIGVGVVGGGYWLLRFGELAARQGDWWPPVAAWAPFFFTISGVAFAVWYLEKRGPQEPSVDP